MGGAAAQPPISLVLELLELEDNNRTVETQTIPRSRRASDAAFAIDLEACQDVDLQFSASEGELHRGSSGINSAQHLVWLMFLLATLASEFAGSEFYF